MRGSRRSPLLEASCVLALKVRRKHIVYADIFQSRQREQYVVHFGIQKRPRSHGMKGRHAYRSRPAVTSYHTHAEAFDRRQWKCWCQLEREIAAQIMAVDQRSWTTLIHVLG
jgi:hypothetical protein